MKMYLGGEWVSRDDVMPVVNPYDNSIIDTVPKAGIEDIDAAVAAMTVNLQLLRLKTRALANSLKNFFRGGADAVNTIP